MSNITVKLDLTQFQHVIQKKKNKAGDEVDCIVIPVESNNLFKSDKGNIYADFIGFPLKTATDYATHTVKQSLSKAVREAMSKEEADKQPFFGNMQVRDGQQSSAPNTTGGSGVTVEEDQDLPF